jgi:benzil reductase ((S)-benzoin forming)
MRAAVITGVSRGLGAALFGELVAAGDAVLAIGRRFTADQQARAAAEPDRIRLLPADLAEAPDFSPVTQFVRGAAEGVLIHNAAQVEPIGAVGALPPDQIATAVAVNLTAPMLLTNAFLAARAPAATILFISSGAARRTLPGWSVYATTKRAGETFFAAVADQEPQLRVVSVNPGRMDTDMQARVRAAARAGRYFPDGDEFIEAHERGKLPDPAAVARRIVTEHLGGPA